jgi:hypothetical protein
MLAAHPRRGGLMEFVVFVLGGLAVGLWAGGSFARFRRSLKDVRGSKGLLAGARKKRYSATVHSLRTAVILAVLLVCFFMGLHAAGRL